MRCFILSFLNSVEFNNQVYTYKYWETQINEHNAYFNTPWIGCVTMILFYTIYLVASKITQEKIQKLMLNCSVCT